MKQELKLLPTGDVEEVNRSVKEGFGGLGSLVTGFGQNELSRSPLGLDPGAVSRVAHDNFHRVVFFRPDLLPVGFQGYGVQRRQRKVSATARKMELLKIGLLMEARINFESTPRFTVFFFSVRRTVVIYRNDFPRPTTTSFCCCPGPGCSNVG